QLIAGDSIEMLYLMTAETSLRVVQGGQEKILTAGDAIFVRGGDTSCIVAQDTTRFINVAVPLSTLTPQRPQCDDLAMTVVPKDNEVLNLLLGYVELLRAQHGKMSAPLAQLAAAHIRDLFATIGDDHPLTAPLPRESAGL